MCPTPEQLATILADKVLVQPTISFGRNYFFESLLINAVEFTPAVHATRFARDQTKLAEYQRYLLRDSQGRREPKCWNYFVAHKAPFHQTTVRGQNDCRKVASLVDEMVCYATPEPFYSVGFWYDDFSQTADDQIRDLLERAAKELTPAAP